MRRKRRRLHFCSLLLLPRMRSAPEEVEQLSAAVKEVEVQAYSGEDEEMEVGECLTVAEWEEDIPPRW